VLIGVELLTSDRLTSEGSLPFTPLEEVSREIETYKAFLSGRKRVHHGRVTLVERGQQPLSFCDEQWHIALHFCGITLAKLTRSNQVTYRVMITGRPIIFMASHAHVRVTLDDGSYATYPRESLLCALSDCMWKYYQLLDRLACPAHLANKARCLEVLEDFAPS